MVEFVDDYYNNEVDKFVLKWDCYVRDYELNFSLLFFGLECLSGGFCKGVEDVDYIYVIEGYVDVSIDFLEVWVDV